MILLVAIPLLLSLWLAYRLLDQGVTVTHQGESIRHHEEARSLLAKIVVDLQTECRRADLEQWLAERYRSGHVVKHEDGALFIDSIGLRFKAGKLTEVVFMD